MQVRSSGDREVLLQNVTDKPSSPVTTRVELTDQPEDGQALASASTIIVSADKALSMQVEETFSLTNVDESEDGRALVSPTSIDFVSTGKALSMQVEETPEDGRALVSPTSLTIVSTGKALSTQIEETSKDGRALVSLTSLNIVSTDHPLLTQIEKTPEDERALVSAACLDIVSIDKAVSLQIEVTMEDGRALVSPTCTNAVHTDHQALSMPIEETPEDGRALVSPTSTNVVPTDQALSMQIEEKPEDGRALVSPTSTNVFSADKALSMQIVGTSLTDIDESGKLGLMGNSKKTLLGLKQQDGVTVETDLTGNIKQEETQNLPFVRISSIWKLIECMEAFKILPQNPHFHPLVKCEEIKCEASAMMNMLNFAYLIEKTLKLQEDDSREYFGIIMEELANFEELGFNFKVVHDHIYERLQKKVKLEELQDESKGFEIQITEHSDKKT
ncbi:hypothetical protein PanWU01x14_075230 [Parasponia andersonii]|uniref:Uncharacterized protein n=1 Tax=Parasponia andersonii TaxID=3476 RepID=A0A2P5DCS3_PARAD|nr:hypothetical protein PanWU01x14_075230 [Parasponia andersonii]